ncbi:MAG TPA: DUF3008 family protein [Vitreimonas sp.]|nr:DUF3008 family protein [Vitreimonas sp.]HYD87960.1 DUF3008 family protein [Vitreimonas sp.]
MPAKSKAQQKAAGAALSAKRGESRVGNLKGPSRQMYETMTEDQLDEFASTARRGKPDHVRSDAAPAVAKSAAKKSGARAVKSRPRTIAKKSAASTAKKRTKKAATKAKKDRQPKRSPPRRSPT